MTPESTLSSVQTIIRDVFADDSIDVDRTTNASSVEYWDSLNNIRIIVAIEKEFRIRFSPLEVEKFANVGSIVDAILKKASA
jgi:acyl carrier protein